MVTYDILIISIILALLTGFWIGALVAGSIMQKTLEKQKPKKPTPVAYLGAENIYKCPNCTGLLSQEYKYCHKCGQALKEREG